MLFRSSFTKAKAIAFKKFVDAVGTLTTIEGWTAEDGKNSFLGFLPPAFDVWGLTIGGGGSVTQTWNTTPPWELHMNADIEGQFAEQEPADEVGMKLLSILDLEWIDDNGATVAPTSGTVRIQHLRLRSGGMFDVFLGPKPIANEGAKKEDGSRAPVLLWELKIGMELVFNTWAEG